jgi:hypothetical protein
MKIVRLPFKDEQRHETERGVVISRWLKEQGLMMGKDYTWMVSTQDRELHFMFNGDAESWATMLAMRDL